MNLTKTEEDKQKINEMKNFLKTECEIYENKELYISDWFVERFLEARKWKVKKAKEMIKGYFEFRKEMEDKFNNKKDYYNSKF